MNKFTKAKTFVKSTGCKVLTKIRSHSSNIALCAITGIGMFGIVANAEEVGITAGENISDSNIPTTNVVTGIIEPYTSPVTTTIVPVTTVAKTTTTKSIATTVTTSVTSTTTTTTTTKKKVEKIVEKPTEVQIVEEEIVEESVIEYEEEVVEQVPSNEGSLAGTYEATWYTAVDMGYTSTPYGASGRLLESGYSIASNSIPFGTLVRIEGGGLDGVYRVDDCGGMANNVIDFYYWDRSCVPSHFKNAGRINISVYYLD